MALDSSEILAAFQCMEQIHRLAENLFLWRPTTLSELEPLHKRLAEGSRFDQEQLGWQLEHTLKVLTEYTELLRQAIKHNRIEQWYSHHAASLAMAVIALGRILRKISRQPDVAPLLALCAEAAEPFHALSESDAKVLRSLGRSPMVALSQYEITELVDLSRKTVSNSLNRLRSLGYAKLPDGKTKGTMITPSGLARLRHLGV